MNAELKKVLRWAVIGALVAFVIDFALTGGWPLSTRITLGIMCSTAGMVTGALLAANFSKEGGESH